MYKNWHCLIPLLSVSQLIGSKCQGLMVGDSCLHCGGLATLFVDVIPFTVSAFFVFCKESYNPLSMVHKILLWSYCSFLFLIANNLWVETAEKYTLFLSPSLKVFTSIMLEERYMPSVWVTAAFLCRAATVTISMASTQLLSARSPVAAAWKFSTTSCLPSCSPSQLITALKWCMS